MDSNRAFHATETIRQVCPGLRLVPHATNKQCRYFPPSDNPQLWGLGSDQCRCRVERPRQARRRLAACRAQSQRCCSRVHRRPEPTMARHCTRARAVVGPPAAAAAGPPEPD